MQVYVQVIVMGMYYKLVGISNVKSDFNGKPSV